MSTHPTRRRVEAAGETYTPAAARSRAGRGGGPHGVVGHWRRVTPRPPSPQPVKGPDEPARADGRLGRRRNGAKERLSSIMSSIQPETQEQRDLNQDDFFDIVRYEGITIDGTFYKSTGHGKQTRYHAYDPGMVKGFDAVREDGDTVAQNVANHEEALVEDVTKDDIKAAYEKYKDGLGVRGSVTVSEPAPEPETDGEDEREPMSDEEVTDTILANFEEHGFFEEDEDGDPKVVSLAHPGARLMGYITGSHIKALPNGMETVDDYRRAVAEAIAELPDKGAPDPDDIPIAPGALMEKFEEWGHQTTDSGFDFSHFNKQRWEEGAYNHLRAESGGGDE